MIKLTADFQPVHQGNELRLIAPKASGSEGTAVPSLVRTVPRVRDWYSRIVTGGVGTIKTLYQRESLQPAASEIAALSAGKAMF